MEKLKALTLGDNALERLPEELRQVPFLEELSLYRNRLERVPDSLTDLRNLQELGLHENRLSGLPLCGWERMNRLGYLALFGNHLSVLPRGLWDLPSLKSLLLHDNPLQWDAACRQGAKRLRERGCRVLGEPVVAGAVGDGEEQKRG